MFLMGLRQETSVDQTAEKTRCFTLPDELATLWATPEEAAFILRCGERRLRTLASQEVIVRDYYMGRVIYSRASLSRYLKQWER